MQPTICCLHRSLPALRISQNEPITGGRQLSSTLAQRLTVWTQLRLHCERIVRLLCPQHGAAPLIAGCLTYRLVNTACNVSISMINIGRQLSDMPEVSQCRVTTVPCELVNVVPDEYASPETGALEGCPDNAAS